MGVDPVGAFDVDCSGVDPVTQTANCTCDLVSIDPIPLLGIGDVCIESGGACPAGPLNCDAGTGVDLDVVADHNSGSCSGNADCAASCDAICAGIGAGYERLDSACEGFCVSGPNFDNVCVQDADCPESSCPGKEPVQGGVHAGVCGCTCVGRGLGDPGPAGAMNCNLGLSITVERDSDPVCGTDSAPIILPPLCGALTTGAATAELVRVNNGRNRDKVTAVDRVGAAVTCPQFAAGAISGMTFAGNLVFYDSSLGDIVTENFFVCE